MEDGFPELPARQLQAVLDGDDRIQAADVVSQFFGQALRRVRIVAAGHVDQEDVFRRQDRRIEGGVDGRIDAARYADDDFMDTDGIHEVPEAVVEAVVNIFDLGLFRLHLRRGRKGPGRFVEVDEEELFRKGLAGTVVAAVFLVGAAGAVKGIDVLAVVLDARAVDVDGRAVNLVDGLAEEAVATLGLA